MSCCSCPFTQHAERVGFEPHGPARADRAASNGTSETTGLSLFRPAVPGRLHGMDIEPSGQYRWLTDESEYVYDDEDE